MLELSRRELVEKQLLDAMESTLHRYHARNCTPDECLASLKDYFDSLTRLIIPVRCVCSWCNRTRMENGFWLIVSAGEDILSPPATHTICPDCKEAFFSNGSAIKPRLT